MVVPPVRGTFEIGCKRFVHQGVPALLHSPPFGADVMRFLIYAVGNPNAKIVVNISFAFCECPAGNCRYRGNAATAAAIPFSCELIFNCFETSSRSQIDSILPAIGSGG